MFSICSQSDCYRAWTGRAGRERLRLFEKEKAGLTTTCARGRNEDKFFFTPNASNPLKRLDLEK